MSKTLLVAGGIAALGATAYYVSPAAFSDPDEPPVLVAGSPAQVRARIDRESRKALFKMAGATAGPSVLSSLQPRWDDSLSGHSNVVFLGDRLVRLDYALSDAGQDRTAIDVKVSFPDSAFSRSAELHPYDLKAAAGLIDLLATEYIGSVVDGRRMASEKELEPRVYRLTGFDKDQLMAFGKRIEAAAKDAYGSRLKSASAWGTFDGRNPYYERPTERAAADAIAASAMDDEAERAERARERELERASAPTDDTRPDRYEY